MLGKVIFLDRDGVINVDRGYVYRREDFELLPGTVEAISQLRKAGFAIAVVTNQSGIARGFYSQQDVVTLHLHLLDELAVDAIAYCPHAPEDNCPCRKPKTGLAKLIETQLVEPIDYPGSWMIGDKPTDIQFGKTLGTRTALLKSPYWTSDSLTCSPNILVDSLFDATERILHVSSI